MAKGWDGERKGCCDAARCGAACERGLRFVNICINGLAARAPGVLMKFAVDIKQQGVTNVVKGEEIISKDAGEVEPGLGTSQEV